MIKPDFNKAVKLATKLLARQTFEKPCISVKELKLGNSVMFDTFENYKRITNAPIPCQSDSACGVTVCLGKKFLILYNEKERNQKRLNWTLAHELGHICLRHECDGDVQEIEANFFAAQLLMPEVVINQIQKVTGKLSYQELCVIFGVSVQAAKHRIKTLSVRNAKNLSSDDKIVLSKFLKHIQNYCSPFLEQGKTEVTK
ncbi:MAG: ImmA/IrrE family metallo-endopeptidase [Oscillospiraceae bacterium]|nr:ImmA/IrrE family metallo-endopeptidase [Oscillospiraceae bacterium]